MNPAKDKGQTETHPAFPSGDWEGFYTYSYGEEAGRHRMAFNLNFENGEVTGGGTDNVGPFTWKGHYDTQTMTCVMLKSYLTHVVLYEGKVDENGIWGTWKISDHFTGGFHLWPTKNEDQAAIEALIEEVNQMIAERVVEF